PTTFRLTVLACSGCEFRRGPPGHSPSARYSLSPPDGHPARCAGFRSTPQGMSAHGRTAIGPVMPDRATAGDMEVPAGERAALELLERGTLEVEGRLIDASNATLYCTIKGGGSEAACVYKPVAGERPLWDFPTGTLAGREVAAYAVSRVAGWNIV